MWNGLLCAHWFSRRSASIIVDDLSLQMLQVQANRIDHALWIWYRLYHPVCLFHKRMAWATQVGSSRWAFDSKAKTCRFHWMESIQELLMACLKQPQTSKKSPLWVSLKVCINLCHKFACVFDLTNYPPSYNAMTAWIIVYDDLKLKHCLHFLFHASVHPQKSNAMAQIAEFEAFQQKILKSQILKIAGYSSGELIKWRYFCDRCMNCDWDD